MSFNVGNGLLTAHISSNRLHEISKNNTPPEMTLWGKIKDFFFSTHQEEALECVYKLYHHSDFGMSNQEIKDVFIKLQTLASPGCKDKFIISQKDSSDEYIIDGEKILSLPTLPTLTNQHIAQDDEEDIWYDCLTDEEMAAAAAAERNLLASEEAYIQSVNIIVPLIEKRLKSFSKATLLWMLGRHSKKAYDLASSIQKKVESQVHDKQELKKIIDELIAIPGVIKLLSDEIIKMPEFILVQKG